MKEDLIELSKVKYGLFNVDEWKKVLARIITKKLRSLTSRGKQCGNEKEAWIIAADGNTIGMAGLRLDLVLNLTALPLL